MVVVEKETNNVTNGWTGDLRTGMGEIGEKIYDPTGHRESGGGVMKNNIVFNFGFRNKTECPGTYPTWDISESGV